MKLRSHQLEKPWGRTELPAIFGSTGGRRIGEIWFEPADAADMPLLVKYIFTSDKLSVQVHPNDEQARARGLAQGKSECWYILAAEPDARLGLGLKSPITRDALRTAALDGSIETLLDWRPVAAGDFFFVPSGTIHAIGAGVSLLEFQQNADVTYRLYDYGRPRELHVDEAVAVANVAPYPEALAKHPPGEGNAVLVDGPHFLVLRVVDAAEVPDAVTARRRWIMPVEGRVTAGSDNAGPGECLLLEPGRPLVLSEDGIALVGAAGSLGGQ